MTEDLRELRSELLKLSSALDMVMFRYKLSYEDTQVVSIKASVDAIIKKMSTRLGC